MSKNLIKELSIIVLLIIIIILILGIIMYQYIPNNKKVPQKIEEYTLDEEIKNEINIDLNLENETIVKTYKVETSDLELYEYKKNYEKGKINPFDNSTNDDTNTNATSNTTNNQENINNTTSESTDYFYNTVGK